MKVKALAVLVISLALATVGFAVWLVALGRQQKLLAA